MPRKTTKKAPSKKTTSLLGRPRSFKWYASAAFALVVVSMMWDLHGLRYFARKSQPAVMAAQWMASKGCRVLLQDVNDAALAKGMERIRKLFKDGVKRGHFRGHEAAAALDRIKGGFDAEWEVATDAPKGGMLGSLFGKRR